MAKPLGKILCMHYDHLNTLLDQTVAYLLMRGLHTKETQRLVEDIKTKARQLSNKIPLDHYPKHLEIPIDP